MLVKKAYDLKVGETFTYLGGFGWYTLLDYWSPDPRSFTFNHLLLFVVNERGRIMPMSLRSATNCEMRWDPSLQDLAKVESLRPEMEKVQDEHFKMFGIDPASWRIRNRASWEDEDST